MKTFALCSTVFGLAFAGLTVCGDEALPSGYTQLEWVGSTGVQWVDTGYTPKAASVIEARLFAHKKQSSDWWCSAFGSQCYDGGAYSKTYSFVVKANAYGYIRYRRTDGDGFSDPDFYERVMDVTCNGKTFTYQPADKSIEAKTRTLTSEPKDAECSVFLFAVNKEGISGDPGMVRFYSFRVLEGEKVVLDLVPCRNPDGEAGFWDRVAGRFLGNIGNGTLRGSDDVPVFVSKMTTPAFSYIDTGFMPNQDTRVKMDVGVKGTRAYWFGAWNVDYKNGAYALGNDVGNVYSGYDGQGGGSGTVIPNGRHTLDFNKNVIYVDGAMHRTFTYSAFQVNYNLYLFAQNRKGTATWGSDTSAIDFYSCQIWDNGTQVRDFRSWLDADGTVGVTNILENGLYYPNLRDDDNRADDKKFTLSGLGYLENGGTLVAYEGTLAAENLTGYTAMTKDGWQVLNASDVTGYTIPLTLAKGTFSLADKAATAYTADALTLNGGATLEVDLTATGCDTLTATTLTLNATAENPFRIKVQPLGVTAIPADTAYPILAGVADGDLAKFKLVSNLPIALAVRNGALAVVSTETPQSLPAGYTALPYIASTGDQYIKTGVTGTSETIVEMSFGHVRPIHSTALFGEFEWTADRYLFDFQSGKFMFHGASVSLLNYTENADYRVWVGCGQVVMAQQDGEQISVPSANTVGTNGSTELAIFALNNGTYGASFRFYEMKILSPDGAYLRHFVPCRNPNGEAGLWDFVSGMFFRNENYAKSRFFTEDDENVFLSRAYVHGGAYINTDFAPNQNTRVVMDMVPDNSKSTFFGVWETAWNNGAFAASNDGSFMYLGYGGGYNSGSNPKAPDSVYGSGRHVLDFDKGVVKWDGETKVSCNAATFQLTQKLFLFGQNRKGAWGVNDSNFNFPFYSAQIYDDGTLHQNFVPYRTVAGEIGLYETVEGRCYENAGRNSNWTYRFTWFFDDAENGLAYNTDGTALRAFEGTLGTNDLAGVTELRKVGWYELKAGGVTNYPALTIEKGTFSLRDGTVRSHTVAGALTLKGGATIALDVTPEGQDAFTAGSVVLDSSATAANPVTIQVSASGIAELASGVALEVIAGGALTADDAEKFQVTGFPAMPQVQDGKLVLVKKTLAVVPWTGAANDGRWSAAHNWEGDDVPADGATVLFDIAGSSTLFDIAGGRNLKSILFGANAGAFTATGTETLGVFVAISNESAAVQSLAMPMTFGLAGLPFELHAAEGAELSTAGGAKTVLADTLVKTGAGLAVVDDDAITSVADVEIREGTLKINHTGRVSGPSAAGALRIAAGAALDINVDNGNGAGLATIEAVRGKPISFAGSGPDGAGAIVNSFVSEKWGFTTGHLILTDDATVGGSFMSVRALAGSAVPGARLEGPCTLTVKNRKVGTMPWRAFVLTDASVDVGQINVEGYLTFEHAHLAANQVSGCVTNGLHFTDGAGLVFYDATVPTNFNATIESGTVALVCGYASIDQSDLTLAAGTTLDCTDLVDQLTLAGTVTIGADATLRKTGGTKDLLLTGTLAGGGAITGDHVHFSGANTRWKMAADDTGFTSKVDVSGITDAAFLTELKAIDVTYTGTTTQTLEIGPAFTWTIDTLDSIALTVTDGAGEPVPDCWLWIADGKLMLHLNDGGYVITAKWLGGAADDIADPANWLCSNKVGEVSGRVPMCATAVSLSDGCAFTCTNGAPFVCRQLNLTATLGGDSDFRGVTAPMNGTIDLQGHKVYFNRADCAVTIRDCEYLILEWLRAPKGAYINTGFKPTSESRVTMDLTVGGAGENWFGSGGTGNNWWKDRAFALSNDGGGIYVGHGSDSGTYGGKILPVGWRGTVELNQNVFTATTNGATVAERTISRTKQTFTALNDMFLFANNMSEKPGTNRFKADNNVTCYGCRIYAKASDAEPVRDFVPAIRLSDGAVGMIDRANGDAWYGNAGSPAFVAGSVTAMPDVGEVHFDIPEGETVTNTGILMKGMLKMVKEGAGTLVAEKTGQIYSGGTEIVAGTLKAQNTGYPCRNTNDVVTVGANATLDVNQTTESNGASAACLYRLEGGTITNSGTAGSTWAGTSQSLGHVVLTDDSSIAMGDLGANLGFGFQNYRTGATTLEMNGHTLTVDTGTGIFFLYNCTVTGGGRIRVTQADRVDVAIGALAASGTELDSAAAVIPYDPGNHVIGDLTLRCPTVHGTTTTITSFNVVGAYKPVADAITGGIVMQDGSTFDLRERTTALDISSKKVTFADDATVMVDVRGRRSVGGKAVITWETDKAPANLTGLTFKAPAGAQYNVTKRADGVYIVSGMVITIR